MPEISVIRDYGARSGSKGAFNHMVVFWVVEKWSKSEPW